mgnify:FL=1
METILSSDGLILPGVGAFAHGKSQKIWVTRNNFVNTFMLMEEFGLGLIEGKTMKNYLM